MNKMIALIFLYVACVNGWSSLGTDGYYQKSKFLENTGKVVRACKDEYESCPQFKDQCKNSASIRKLCKMTCNGCPAVAPMSCFASRFGCCWDNVAEAAGPNGEGCTMCEDKEDYCSKLTNFCSYDRIKAKCPYTCNVKGCAVSMAASDCQDDEHQRPYCRLYKKSKFCETNVELMVSYCKKTCELCHYEVKPVTSAKQPVVRQLDTKKSADDELIERLQSQVHDELMKKEFIANKPSADQLTALITKPHQDMNDEKLLEAILQSKRNNEAEAITSEKDQESHDVLVKLVKDEKAKKSVEKNALEKEISDAKLSNNALVKLMKSDAENKAALKKEIGEAKASNDALVHVLRKDEKANDVENLGKLFDAKKKDDDSALLKLLQSKDENKEDHEALIKLLESKNEKKESDAALLKLFHQDMEDSTKKNEYVLAYEEAKREENEALQILMAKDEATKLAAQKALKSITEDIPV